MVERRIRRGGDGREKDKERGGEGALVDVCGCD